MVEVSADIERQGIGGRATLKIFGEHSVLDYYVRHACLLDDSDRVRDITDVNRCCCYINNAKTFLFSYLKKKLFVNINEYKFIIHFEHLYSFNQVNIDNKK